MEPLRGWSMIRDTRKNSFAERNLRPLKNCWWRGVVNEVLKNKRCLRSKTPSSFVLAEWTETTAIFRQPWLFLWFVSFVSRQKKWTNIRCNGTKKTYNGASWKTFRLIRWNHQVVNLIAVQLTEMSLSGSLFWQLARLQYNYLSGTLHDFLSEKQTWSHWR